MYQVNTIYNAIQGEGALTGTPMVLVRLQGCNLTCKWCDTKGSWNTSPANKVTSLEKAIQDPRRYAELGVEQLLAHITRVKGANDINWVLLTGGEPTLQDIEPLCRALRQATFKVALETNGTAMFSCRYLDWVAVSPKLSVAPDAVLFETLVLASEVKFVIGSEEDLLTLDAFLTAFRDAESKGKLNVEYLIPLQLHIALQPLSTDPQATTLCVSTCLHRGWRLSVQTHKYLGLA
jgi:7-carboxy-7-deazaguanine synthase